MFHYYSIKKIFFFVYLSGCDGSYLWQSGSSVFTVAFRIFSCGRQTLSCSMWGLVPWPGIKHAPPALGAQSLGHPESPSLPFKKMFTRCWSVILYILGQISNTKITFSYFTLLVLFFYVTVTNCERKQVVALYLYWALIIQRKYRH